MDPQIDLILTDNELIVIRKILVTLVNQNQLPTEMIKQVQGVIKKLYEVNLGEWN